MENISGLLKKSTSKKENKRIHSEAHQLADEISEYFKEKNRFGMYLGIINRLGVPNARAIFSKLKSESSHVKTPKKLFMWMTRKPKKDDKESKIDPKA